MRGGTCDPRWRRRFEESFGVLTETSGLKGSMGVFVGLELVEKDGVVFAVTHVAAKVVYSEVDDGQDERSGMRE